MEATVTAERVNEIKMKPRARRAIMVAAALAVGAILVMPFYYSRSQAMPDGTTQRLLISTHDLGNLIPMMQQFDKVIKSGVFYPRWHPDPNKGYGTATPNFYPPGFFYASTLVNLALDNWINTLYFLTALALAASGLSFYFFARTFYSRLASASAALLYMLLPIHQLDLYWRGSIPQFVGYAFMPAVLWFAYKLGREGRWRYYAGLGLAHGLYLLTHLPVGYLFTYTLAFYAALWAFKERDLKIALRIAAGMAISLLVSAIYWLPAALESKYIWEWASETFPYHSVYITMAQTSDIFSQNINWIFNYNALIVAAAAIILSFRSRDSYEKAAEKKTFDAATWTQTQIFFVLAIFAPFMSTSFSIHISKLIPRIQIAVPPFRWLAIACLFSSLIVAASIDHLRAHIELAQARKWAYRIAIGAVVALNLWLTFHVINGALSNPVFNPSNIPMDVGFLPKGAARPDKLPDTARVIIEPEGGFQEVARWDPQYQQIHVKVNEQSRVRLRTFNFPGWTARIDGTVTPITTDEDGAQVVSVPPGLHTIETSLESTGPRLLGTALAGVGFLLVFGLTLVDRLQTIKQRTANKVGANKASKLSSSQNLQYAGEINAVEAASENHANPITNLLAGRKGKFIIAGLALAIAIALFALVAGRSSTRNVTSNTASGNSVSGGGKQPGITIDSDAKLLIQGLDSVPAAVDEPTLDELVRALSSKDGVKLDALTQSGKVFDVPINTRVLVLQRNGGKAQVRISEGSRATAECWVAEQWIR
jgi:6-pyruvoyl-tetrahydropterin synthase-like protein